MSDDLLGDEEVLIPCEFCEELCPLEELIEHQSSCRPDLLHFPNDGSSVNIEKKEQIELDHAIAKSISDFPDLTVQQDIFQQKNDENITPASSISGEQKKVSASVKFSTLDLETIPLEGDEADIKNIEDNEQHYLSGMSTNKTGSLNFDHDNMEAKSENDYKLSDDDDDDNQETVESFLKRAAIVLKKRLDCINSGKFQNEGIQRGKDSFKPKWNSDLGKFQNEVIQNDKDSFRPKWSRDTDVIQNKFHQKGDGSQFKWKRST